MKYLVRYIPLFLVVAAIGLDRFAVNCLNTESCGLASLIWPIFFTVIKPLYIYSLVFGLVAVILIFIKRNVFMSWLYFAAWWLPLSAVLIALTPTWSNSWFDLYPLVKEDMALYTASLFTAISLILIVWKQFNLGKRLT